MDGWVDVWVVDGWIAGVVRTTRHLVLGSFCILLARFYRSRDEHAHLLLPPMGRLVPHVDKAPLPLRI